jgi:hypothetical protein
VRTPLTKPPRGSSLVGLPPPPKIESQMPATALWSRCWLLST